MIKKVSSVNYVTNVTFFTFLQELHTYEREDHRTIMSSVRVE